MIELLPGKVYTFAPETNIIFKMDEGPADIKFINLGIEG